MCKKLKPERVIKSSSFCLSRLGNLRDTKGSCGMVGQYKPTNYPACDLGREQLF